VHHAREAHSVELRQVAGKGKIVAVSRNLDVVVRIRPAKPLMGLVRVVAPEFLVMNCLDVERPLNDALLALYNRLSVVPMILFR